jgi:hypothetical protein
MAARNTALTVTDDKPKNTRTSKTFIILLHSPDAFCRWPELNKGPIHLSYKCHIQECDESNPAPKGSPAAL